MNQRRNVLSCILLSAVAVVLSGSLATSARSQVVLPGTQPGDLENWPLERPSDCQVCHGSYIYSLDYEPFDSWEGSMMANAGRDPLFWAAVDIANQDVAGSGELCIRCHSPRGWLEGRSSTADGSALVGYPDEIDNDFDGIECHFCHRMYEGPDQTPFTQNGQYWIDDGTPTQEPPRRGPFQESFAPHPAQYSSYTTSSELCGTCHDLVSPFEDLLDENGQSTGIPFPEQLTYTEWANSDFAVEGTDCQDCHMPPAAADPAFACSSFNPPRPDLENGDPAPVSRHDLVGANTFVPRILAGEYGAALGRTEAYEATIAKAEAMLQQQSATVEMTPPSWAVEGDTMLVDVKVTNLAGHKLPTGYPEGRRMWLEVVARDALGAPFFVSGEYDTTTATLVEDAQLRIYHAEHGVEGEGTGFHLVRNNRIFSDTRIPPRGFQPVPGSEPVGRDYPVQPDGSLAHWDDVRYAIAVPPGVDGPVSVEAKLRYQTASREYVEFLRDENTSGPDPKDRNYPNAPSRGQKIHDLWMQYGRSAPVDMVSDGAVISVTAAPANVSSLQATPGHNRVDLSWQLPPSAVGVKILRRGWGDHPQYGSTGGNGAAPLLHSKLADALAAGWIEVYDGSGSSFSDTSPTNATRDIAHYAAYAYDENGIHAPCAPENAVAATTYMLGDLGEVGVAEAYDGAIDGALDLPVFSLTYGTDEGEPGFDPEADFAPTDDGSREGVPLPDDRVDFLDLVVFSQQFGRSDGMARVPARPVVTSGPVVLHLGSARVVDGLTRIAVRVEEGRSRLRAGHLLLSGEAARALIAVEPGEALRGSPHFAGIDPREEGRAVDFALLGPAAVLEQDGEVLELVFERSVGPLQPTTIDLRDAAGKTLESELRSEGTPPTASGARLSLSPNVPNPFNPRTTVALRLQEDAHVVAVVYDIAGRRVRTLHEGRLEAGTHELVWKGIDEQGRAVASGVYVLRASSEGVSAHRRMVLVR